MEKILSTRRMYGSSTGQAIATQHIATMLAQHFKTPAKRSIQLSTTSRNIVELFATLLQRVAACWVLKIELVRMTGCGIVECCTNLVKRLQHHTTSTNVA